MEINTIKMKKLLADFKIFIPYLKSLKYDPFSDFSEVLVIEGIVIKSNGIIAMKKVNISTQRICSIKKKANNVAATMGPITRIMPVNK
jgi:hypothetical protein